MTRLENAELLLVKIYLNFSANQNGRNIQSIAAHRLSDTCMCDAMRQMHSERSGFVAGVLLEESVTMHLSACLTCHVVQSKKKKKSTCTFLLCLSYRLLCVYNEQCQKRGCGQQARSSPLKLSKCVRAVCCSSIRMMHLLRGGTCLLRRC